MIITNSKLINKKFITQFLHQWLPLNGSPSSTSQSKLCPLCNETAKTFDHFLTCSHPTVKLLWTNCAKEIQSTATRTKNDPVLCTLMCEICSTQRQADVITRPDSCTEAYDKLFLQQTPLGWKQLLQGRISTEWAVMQGRYLNDTKQGAKTIQSLISILLLFAHQAWLLRNSAEHGSTSTFLQNKVRYRLLPRLEAIYAIKHRLLAIDQTYFDIEKATVALLPPALLEAWLIQAESFIKGALQRQKTHTRLHTRPLRHYFPIKATIPHNTTTTLRASTHLQAQLPRTTTPTQGPAVAPGQHPHSVK